MVLTRPLKIFTGYILGVYAVSAIENAWIAPFALFFLGAVFQTLYARSLYEYLGGIDPVRAFGTKNIYELRYVISIPMIVLVLDFLAKIFIIGGATGMLTAWYFNR